MKSTFFSVFLTYFVDVLSWAIVFPIFAPYFLDPNNRLFSPEITDGMRAMVLGFFLTAFSLGQFLGAPVMGEYADKHGRRRALLIAVFCTFMGLCLTAWSMERDYLILLFVGRFFTGLFASSTSICLTCISDISESDNAKVKNFGYLSTIAGFAFMIGAFFGGKLSDASLNRSFFTTFPIWIAAGLCLANFFSVLWGFRETAHHHPTLKFHFFQSFGYIKMALRTEKIKRIYTVYFLFLFAWTILFQFTPVLMVEKFSLMNASLGNVAVFMGACWMIGSGVLNKQLSSHFKHFHILEFCLLSFTVLCGAIIWPHYIPWVLAILGTCVALGGLAWPLCTGHISNMTPSNMQGKILGVSQAIQSFSMALAPTLGGLTFHLGLSFPFLTAALVSLTAAIVYYFTLKPR